VQEREREDKQHNVVPGTKKRGRERVGGIVRRDKKEKTSKKNLVVNFLNTSPWLHASLTAWRSYG